MFKWYYIIFLKNCYKRNYIIIFQQGEISQSNEEREGGKKDYIETLKYFPSEKHDGKALRCQVEHQAFTDVQKNDKQNEAEVILRVQCKYCFRNNH